MEAREFGRHDWDGFAGAERWGEAPPLMAVGKFADGREVVLVLDRTGGCVLVEDDPQNDAGGYVLALPSPTQLAAKAFARGMGEPQRLEDFLAVGFEAI